MYLIIDDYADDKKIMNYKQLKDLLIDELMANIKENYEDYDFVKYDLDILTDIAKETINHERVINELQTYGWTIIDITNIKKALNEMREYAARKTSDTKVFDEIIKYIDEELN